MNRTVLLFGDGIGIGQWDAQGGWAARISRDLMATAMQHGTRQSDTLYNLSVDGDTSHDVVQRMHAESLARAREGGVNVTLVHIGLQNAFHLTRGSSRVEMCQMYEAHLKQMAGICAQVRSRLMFIGLIGADEERFDPGGRAFVGEEYRDEDLAALNRTLVEFCFEQRHPLVQVRDEFFKAGLDHVLSDGVRPNTQGHQLLHDLVREPLTQLLAGGNPSIPTERPTPQPAP